MRTLGQTFGHSGVDIVAHQEMLRAQARQANEKVERDIEARLAAEFRGDSRHAVEAASDRGLSGAYMYDSEKGTNILIGRASTRAASVASVSMSHVMPALSRRQSQMVASPPYTREPTNYYADSSPARQPTALPRASSQAAQSVISSQRGGFKRKSLALAKATRRRLSNNPSVRTGTGGRRSVLWGQGTHTVPSLTRRRLAQQAEKERAQLLRLAAELKLPRTDEHNAAAARWEPVGPEAPSAKSAYSLADEEAPATSYSPTSTTGFTSVSRAQSRFGTELHMEELLRTDPNAPPLPAYEPGRFASTGAAAASSPAGSRIGLHQRYASNASSAQPVPVRLHSVTEACAARDVTSSPVARQWASKWADDSQRGPGKRVKPPPRI